MKFLKTSKIKNLIIHNLWLKIISLIVAIIVWLYVSGEIIKVVRI